MNILVSIVVPIFNSEKYLDETISSILSQTYKNIELILVNDGSTDRSLEICTNYEKTDERVFVVNQTNQGVSAARNKGIVYAKGEYIQFVDSDDIVDPRMTEKLVNKILKDSDLVICGYTKVLYINNKPKENKFLPLSNGESSLESFMNDFFYLFNSTLIHSPCNKLYNLKKLKKQNIKFPINVNNGEDLLFNIRYLEQINSVYLLKESLYNYNIYNNESSLTKKYKENYLSNRKKVFFEVNSFIASYHAKDSQEFLDQVFINYTYSILSNIFHKNSVNNRKFRNKEILELINDVWIRDNIDILSDSYQDKLIGYLIKKKYKNGLIIFFSLKEFLRKYFKTVFNLIKRIL